MLVFTWLQTWQAAGSRRWQRRRRHAIDKFRRRRLGTLRRAQRAGSATCERLEERVMLSALGLTDAAFGPGAADAGATDRIVRLDFDGASDIAFDGPVRLPHHDVPAFTADTAGLGGQEGEIVARLLADLNTDFDAEDVTFVAGEAPWDTPYSTIHVGGTDADFADFGSFYGLAEHNDPGDRDPSDTALVFSESIAATHFGEEFVTTLAAVIGHEAGRLTGRTTDADRTGPGVLGHVAYTAVPANAVGGTGDLISIALPPGGPEPNYQLQGVDLLTVGAGGAVTVTPLAVTINPLRGDWEVMAGGRSAGFLLFSDRLETPGQSGGNVAFAETGRLAFAPGTADGLPGDADPATPGFQGLVRLRYRAGDAAALSAFTIRLGGDYAAGGPLASGDAAGTVLGIARLQQRLRHLGFPDADGTSLVVDGIVGPKTRNASACSTPSPPGAVRLLQRGHSPRRPARC